MIFKIVLPQSKSYLKNDYILYTCIALCYLSMPIERDICRMIRSDILLCVISVRPSKEPGWLEGCLNGRIGLVPANYVEFVD